MDAGAAAADLVPAATLVLLRETEETAHPGLLSSPLISKMKYALIEIATGRVDNVILWDGEAYFPAPEGCELIALGDVICDIDWIYANGTFTAPTE
jgi:hypothetical protein